MDLVAKLRIWAKHQVALVLQLMAASIAGAQAKMVEPDPCQNAPALCVRLLLVDRKKNSGKRFFLTPPESCS